MRLKFFFQPLAVLFFLNATALFSYDALVITETGKQLICHMEKGEPFSEIEKRIKLELSENDKIKQVVIEFEPRSLDDQTLIALDIDLQRHGQFLGYPRNYFSPVTHTEKKDISYILDCLATKSLISLAMHRDALEAAGDRIDHLHPLCFLRTVFTDEQLKVDIRNVRSKGWVWHEFLEGIKESLATESRIGNIKKEHVQDFAKQLGVPEHHAYLTALINDQKWDEFVDFLIVNVPRKGDHRRFDN